MRSTVLRICLPALLVALLPFAGTAAEPSRFAVLVAEIEARRVDAGVEGLAWALVEDGRVVHHAAHGLANAESGRLLTERSVMYAASFTKTAFAHLVLQLVDEGRLDLDAPVAELLPRPLPAYDGGEDGDEDWSDLAGDDRWRALTPRILLSHGSGFHNFRWLEDDDVLRFHFDPGTDYAYSAEGYYIAQFVLEEGLGLDVAAAMDARVFERFGMERTAMAWRADFADDLADRHRADGSVRPHDDRSNVSAAGSMDSTIVDQARLWAGIVRGEGLSDAARAELVAVQQPIASPRQFPPLPMHAPRDGRYAHLGLAGGLGLVRFDDPERGLVWFKGGHDDATGNLVVCVDAERRCAVLMANDVRAEALYPGLVALLIGETALPWCWEYGWLPECAGR